MALTLTQKPTTPNASRTNLLYTLTSDSSSKDQFRYIVDITGSEMIPTTGRDLPYPDVRLKYYPNTTGSGIIDLAPIFNRYLAYDEESMHWNNDVGSIEVPAANGTIQTFSCSFGEEYADSPSSSLTVVTGSVNDLITVFQGKVDPESGDYNFNTSSVSQSNNNFMSDIPDALYSQSQYDFILECPKLGFRDRQTVTLLKDNDYRIRVMEEASDLYTGSALFTFSGSTSEELSVVCCGSQNILQTDVLAGHGSVTASNAGWIVFDQPGTGYKPLNFMLPNHSQYPCDNVNYTATGSIQSKPADTYVRFAWQNNYGMWDFYNVYNTLREVNTVDRKSYTQPLPIYNQTTSPFNINNRGEKQYSSILTEQFTISTDYISKKTADWLTQMFDSNNVFVILNSQGLGEPKTYLQEKYGSDKRAIIINNVNYRWQENKFRNKTFQFDINWQFSNKSFVY